MTPAERKERYVDAAVRGARAAVGAAEPGTRHKTVNRESYALGRLVGAGAMSYGDAEQALLGAAPIGPGYPETRAQREISNGLRDGMKDPARLPEGLSDQEKPRPSASPSPSEKPYLHPAQVHEFWDLCIPVSKDEQVSSYLESRNIDPFAVAALDLARALPLGVKVRRWAAFGDRAWTRTGHRLILRLFGTDLRPKNVIARRIIDDETPKGLSAQGHARAGLCMLDYPAGVLLRHKRWSEHWPGASHPRLVITEGEIDTLGWATHPTRKQSPTTPSPTRGTIGIVQGSWTPEWVGILPPHVDITIATDTDRAGREYAERIMVGLEAAGHSVRRWKPKD